ncbi:MAG: nucleotide exchange factor GrpE [Clostridia bacterium]|nr:nucleotide exchange factor GrpE [Oscillospiraceae bacterium]MBR4893215.1 nucleotide exchange factor GrpE [Clostridia bacterium]
MNRLEQKEKIKNEEEVKEEVETTVENEESKEEEDFKDKYIRILAEFDNYKKRTQKEKGELYEYTLCELISKMLPVFDTLKLALTHETKDEALKTGVELTIKQFEKVLNDLNVVEIEALGQTFDPNCHNAVMHIDDENYKEKEIVEVFQTGYRLNDKIIRYSMVKVAN